MKLIILLTSILFSAQTFACECSYVGWYLDNEINSRVGTLLEVDAARIMTHSSDVKYTALSTFDPERYSQCGCTQYVKVIKDIVYPKADTYCSATAIYQVWNDKIKVKNIDCK